VQILRVGQPDLATKPLCRNSMNAEETPNCPFGIAPEAQESRDFSQRQQLKLQAIVDCHGISASQITIHPAAQPSARIGGPIWSRSAAVSLRIGVRYRQQGRASGK
jgi:hypothetical protein